MSLGIALILLFTSWFTTALPQGFQFGGNIPTLTITQICAVQSDMCTITGNVSTGTGLVLGIMNEGAVPTLTVIDSCSDVWNNQIGANDSSSGVGVKWTKTTCPMTSGVSTISATGFGGAPLLVYTITPFASSSAQDQDATNSSNTGTSWTVGPTSSQSGNGVCFVFSSTFGQTFSVGAGWTISPGSNNVSNGDNRNMFSEYMKYTSGNTVTGAVTLTGGNTGGMVVKCLKQS